MKNFKELRKEIQHHLKNVELDEIHAPGTKVRVPHKGKAVPGKVVRHDKGDKHGSPFYVVDVGEYESPKVPAHQVRTEEVEQIDEVKLVNIMRHPEHGKAYIWHKGGEGGYNYEVEHTKSKKKETHKKSHEDVVAGLKKQGYKMHEEVEQIGEATKSYWTGGHLNVGGLSKGKSTLPPTKTAPPLAPRVELGVAKKINPGDWNKMRDPKSDKRTRATAFAVERQKEREERDKRLAILNKEEVVGEGAVPADPKKVVTLRHKTSGKEIRVVDRAVNDYKKQGWAEVKPHKEDVEHIIETRRMSAAAKLSQAFDRVKKRHEAAKTHEQEMQEKGRKEFEKNHPEYAKKSVGEETESVAEGFDDHKAIAQELIKRHGKKVNPGHVKDIADERDSRGSLDHGEVMHHVNKTLKSMNRARHLAQKAMQAQKKKLKESVRHPLKGHEYHKKTDAELKYIGKDAHKAAEAMKGHNTTAENKYRDQANDSATVRHYRKTHGMADWYKKKYGHMNEGYFKRAVTDKEEDARLAAQNTKDAGWKKAKPDTVGDKSGAVHSPMSRARHLAQMAMKKQENKKPVKEEMSRKAQIVKEAASAAKKKKKKSNDTFQDEPIIGKSEVRM